MSWLSSHGNVLAGLGSVANFIPGVGPLIGAGLTAAGGLLSAGEAQKQADQARNALSGQLGQSSQLYQMLTQYAQQDPYAAAGQYDPYSPMLNEARTMGYRDDTAQQLRNQLATLDATLRPQGGVRSSAMDYAKAAAIRDSSAQNAAFARNLRVQGGVERYNNAVRASDEKFRRMSSAVAGQTGLNSQYESLYSTQARNAADISGGLAASIAAIAKAGLGSGPRGGQTGANRGNNTLGTNQQPYVPGPNNSYTVPSDYMFDQTPQGSVNGYGV
jgi:hypothetical protein